MAVKEGLATPDGPPADFKGNIRVDDKLPTRKELAKAGEIEVFDKDNKAHKFSSLYTHTDGVARTCLVIFIRHFFCGNCQEYVRLLSEQLPPSSLPPSTSIIVVGCGQTLHIENYAANSNCVYPIYADPSRRLYQILRMTRTLNLGSRSPDYLGHTSIKRLALRSVWQELKAGRQMLSGGDFMQVGGEFILSSSGNGEVEVIWCKRMRNTRDHAEVSELKQALGLNKPTTPVADITEKPTTTENDTKPSPEKRKRWSSITGATSGIGRRLSKRNPRSSWHPATNGSATKPGENTPLANGDVAKPPSPGATKEAEQERHVMEQLREEPEGKATGTEDALAKLTGTSQPPATPAEANGASVEGEYKANAPEKEQVRLNGNAVEEKEGKASSTTNGQSNIAEEQQEKDTAASTVALPSLTTYQNGSATNGAPAEEKALNGAPIEKQGNGSIIEGHQNGHVIAT